MCLFCLVFKQEESTEQMATIMKLHHRAAQGATRLALAAALARFKAANPGVTDADIEKSQGISPGALSLECNEHAPLKVHTLVQAMRAMDGEYVEPLFALCAEFGMRPERVKPYDGEDIQGVHQAVSHTVKEFSETLQAVMAGIADGKMDPSEVAKALKEARELQVAIDYLLGALLALGEK